MSEPTINCSDDLPFPAGDGQHWLRDGGLRMIPIPRELCPLCRLRKAEARVKELELEIKVLRDECRCDEVQQLEARVKELEEVLRDYRRCHPERCDCYMCEAVARTLGEEGK